MKVLWSYASIKPSKNSLNAQFRWVDIDFVGEENSPLGYELLEALKAGNELDLVG